MTEETNNNETVSTESDTDANVADTESNESEQKTASIDPAELNHIYYQIESDLLAKPNALVDLLITNPCPTIIFCNQPSEADLAEVVLTKRQVTCHKLIGRVPSGKVASCAQEVIAGDVMALIVTDISARDLDVGSFQRLINYTIHEDPEIYLHRCDAQEKKDLANIISLVSPLDHGNFHYLKKVVDFEFELAELPGSEEIQAAVFNQLIKDAESCEYPEESKVDELVEQIKKADNYESILKYLVYNTAYVLPELKVKATGGRLSRRDDDDRGDSSSRQTGERVDGDDFSEEEARILNRNVPKKVYMRFYVGASAEDGYDQEKLAQLMSEAANLPADQICNYIDRGTYAFVDIVKEDSVGLVEIMDGYSLENGKTLVFKKAATIVTNLDESADSKKAKPADNQGESQESSEEE